MRVERLVRPRGPDHLGAAGDPARGAPSAHPDREYLRYADGPWVSYGEVNARANRVANGLIARGVRPRRVGQRAAAQLRGVRAGLVRDPEGRARS